MTHNFKHYTIQLKKPVKNQENAQETAWYFQIIQQDCHCHKGIESLSNLGSTPYFLILAVDAINFVTSLRTYILH